MDVAGGGMLRTGWLLVAGAGGVDECQPIEIDWIEIASEQGGKTRSDF